MSSVPWLVALGATLVLGVEFSGLDEALEAARQRERLAGRVPEAVADQAVAAVTDAAALELELLAQVATAGGARAQLAGALLTRHLAEPGERTLRLLLRVERAALREGARAIPGFTEGWVRALEERDAPPSGPELLLLVRAGDPPAVVDRLRQLGAEQELEELRRLASLLGETAEPAAMLEPLLALELPAELEGTLREGLVALVRRAPQLTGRLLELLQRADDPRRARALAGLAGAGPDQTEAAAARLRREITAGSGDVQAAAIAALAALDEVAPTAPVFEAVLRRARSGAPAEQTAALRALDALRVRHRASLAGQREAIVALNAAVEEAVTTALATADGGEPAVLVAALAAARHLGLRAALAERLPELIQDEDPAIRRAALAAAPDGLELRLETVDLLLAAMKDSETGPDACRALQLVARVRLPLERSDMWAQWRAGLVLPSSGEE